MRMFQFVSVLSSKQSIANQSSRPTALQLKCVSDNISRGGGVLPYMGYMGMCGPKGYVFSAVLVINRVSILADFGHFGHK